jgi:Fungal hydrophobin
MPFLTLASQVWRKSYKRAAHEPAIPQSKAQLQDYHSLHPVFTMMLYKPFVSLVAVLAAASSVAATTIPVARDDGGFPPPNLTPVSQCNTGAVQCCNTFTSTSNPLVGILTGIVGLAADAALGVGITCTNAVLGSTQW